MIEENKIGLLSYLNTLQPLFDVIKEIILGEFEFKERMVI